MKITKVSMSQKKQYSAPAAASELGVVNNTITKAIADGKLKAKKIGMIWVIDEDDLRAYEAVQFQRFKTKKDGGGPVWDRNKGKYSPLDISELCGISVQTVYYWLRTGKIPSTRYRSSWIIHQKDFEVINEFLKNRP